MLPNNKISATPTPSQFLLPTRVEPLITNSLGGLEMDHTATEYVVWQGVATGSKVSISNGVNSYDVLDVDEDIICFDFGFTLNMSLVIAWETENGAFFKFYDSVSASDKVMKLDGCRNLCVNLDDIRENSSNMSDVILSYQKSDGGLYVRYQRDRYGEEIKLSSEYLGELKQSGMMEGNRFGWAFTDSYKFKRS